MCYIEYATLKNLLVNLKMINSNKSIVESNQIEIVIY